MLQQKNSSWGDGLIPRFAKDLKEVFPHLTGFSRTNLFYIRKWYLFYSEQLEIVPQLVGQFQASLLVTDNQLLLLLFSVPWGHHRHIIDKCSDANQAIFYLKKTV